MSNLPEKQPDLFPQAELEPESRIVSAMLKRHKMGNYTGERLAKRDEAKYRQVVEWLSEGKSVNLVSKLSGWCWREVDRIRQREPKLISEGKQSLAALCFTNARAAAEGFREDLADGKVSPKDKAIGFGIFSEKGLLLEGHATQIVEERRIVATPDDIRKFVEANKPVQGGGPGVQKGSGSGAPDGPILDVDEIEALDNESTDLPLKSHINATSQPLGATLGATFSGDSVSTGPTAGVPEAPKGGGGGGSAIPDAPESETDPPSGPSKQKEA